MTTITNDQSTSTIARYGVPFIAGGRMFAGALSWASPKLSSRVFLLGRPDPDGRTSVLARLFGVRDLALGLALRHPSAEVRKLALQAGVVIDSADVVASVLAVRGGGPKSILLGVTSAAALFVVLGLGALADDR